MHRDKSAKSNLAKNIYFACYERASYHFCWKSVSGPVQACPYTYPRGWIELFQVSLTGFQKFFLFYIAGMILKAWEVELEPAISFGIWTSEKTLCFERQSE